VTAALRRRGLAVAATLALTAGCGLSANSEPRVIASNDLPTELRDPSPSSSTTLGQSPATASVFVYFLVQQDGAARLVAVPREVKDATRPRDRLAALLVPPTPAEQAQGLLTSIPADTVLIETKLDDTTGVLTIDLSRSLFDIQGQELRNAFAQLVWTATDVAGVHQVRFLVAGQEYRVPDQDGIEQPGAVTRADYATLTPTAPPP
jgi:spore germination protein GerM